MVDLVHDDPRLRVVEHPTAGRAAQAAEALAHLLACLDVAVRLMDECGHDVDARVVEGHRAQLARGREWPGDEITPVVFSDGSTSGDIYPASKADQGPTATREGDSAA